MRISTSNLIRQQSQPFCVNIRRNEDKNRGTPIDSMVAAPAVADRIKAFEDLIRRASRFDATTEDEEGNKRKKRSQSCPARNGMMDSRSIQTFQHRPAEKGQPHRLDDRSNTSLFNCGSTTSSSGYTSTTPPSPEPEISSSRYIFLTNQPVEMGHFSAHDKEVEEEDKQIELEIFARNPSSNSRLFSATSTDDEVDVDEVDIDDIRWSDLESEMDLDQVVDILIQSKTSNEVFFF